MASPILATKLHIPTPQTNAVPRPQLVAHLNAGLGREGPFLRKLSLISAPAGFGKTTVVSEWLANSIRNDSAQPAWLSLDSADNDPTRFWSYLIAALQTQQAQIGQGALGLLQSPQPRPIETVLTTLINEINLSTQALILVLDDYHLIQERSIHEGLAFLLEQLPPQLHLVIASRADPPFPIARLRARGLLSELRVTDLRFSSGEAVQFLNQRMGLSLKPQDLAALEARTEGWIAGLQMAALSLQGRSDPHAFIQAFSGSHRFIIDYLLEEVLEQQPGPLREFLLETSILDRLSGPICAAVTGRADSQDLLLTLASSNLFVIPLDEQRQWFRYHHLFAEVLLARLRAEFPDQIISLHQRASAWYAQQGQPAEAIRHALAGSDFDRAAELVEAHWLSMRRTRQEATLLGWIKALPDQLISVRPVLSVAAAWALLDGREPAAAEARLVQAEQLLTTQRVASDDRLAALPASIANARAYRAQALGDVSQTVTFARQALDLLPPEDHYERGTTAALLGLVYWTTGDLDLAYRSFAEGLSSLRKDGGILIEIGGTVILANIRMAQGQLSKANADYQRAIPLAADPQGRPLPGAAEMYLGLSELSRERGDLKVAQDMLAHGRGLGEAASLPGFEYLWFLAEARLKTSQGDFVGALDKLEQADELFYTSPIPDLRPIASIRARLWTRTGQMADALGWIQARQLTLEDELSYLREHEHISLAHILLAQQQDAGIQSLTPLLDFLERLLVAAQTGERNASTIEILMLQALTWHAGGERANALDALGAALQLAEAEGYVQIFIDEGKPVTDLLVEALKNPRWQAHAARILRSATVEPTPTSASSALIEPLSGRELEVLKLLNTELSGPEIARELSISLNTLRTHTKNIYSKLDVRSRRAALRRAAELDLA
jgi:LuxR family maltose regulon positive regulatory protein